MGGELFNEVPGTHSWVGVFQVECFEECFVDVAQAAHVVVGVGWVVAVGDASGLDHSVVGRHVCAVGPPNVFGCLDGGESSGVDWALGGVHVDVVFVGYDFNLEVFVAGHYVYGVVYGA